MIKRIAALMLAVLIALCAAGCAITDNGTNDQSVVTSFPEPTAPVRQDIKVTSETKTANPETFTQIITLTGTLPDGTVVWEYTTPESSQTELECVEFIGCCNGLAYVNVQGVMDDEGYPGPYGLVAVDDQTGEVKWINKDFTGASVHSFFDDEGTIYICGFYGPDCLAIDKDGNTLWQYQNPNDYYWAYDIQPKEDHIEITFDAYESGDGICRVTYAGENIE